MIDKEDIEALHPEYYDIKVTDTKEHEDGSATYSFDMSEDTAVTAAKLGLELLLYCAASGMSTQEVFDWVLSQSKPTPEVEPFYEYGFYGENNPPV